MKNNIPCEVIRDLLPSYIDELISEVTEKEVKEHIAGCENCRKVLDEMKNPEVEPDDADNLRVIDCFRIARRKHRSIIALCMAVVIVMCAGVPAVSVANEYLSGVAVHESLVRCSVEVDGNELTASAFADSDDYAVKDLDFNFHEGKVDITYKTVKKSVLFKNARAESYTADTEITEVSFGKKIIWADGIAISPMTADIYATKHTYIGDMSKNSETAAALNINHLGRFINKLQTSAEPYDWKIIFLNSYSSARQEEMERTLTNYGYVMLSMVDNLGSASFEYIIDGKEKLLTVNAEEATEFMGEDIKTVGSSVSKFEELMKKTGLSENEYVIAENGVTKNYLNNFTVQLTNKVAGIGEISLLCYVDGKLCSKQTAMLEDSSATVDNYPVLFFKLIPADLKCDKWQGEKEIEFRFSLTDYKGETHLVDAEGVYTLGAELGKTYTFELDGSSRFGYMLIEQ